ncbi:MAG: LysE family translocator [Pseudomonadota bacterium]
MPSSEFLVPFFLATAIFACVPGPGMLYAAAQTLSLGRRAGWWSALGLHIAGLGQVAAAAFGVSTLLAVVPALFTAMKFGGAAYLIWTGVKYLTSPRSPVPRANGSTMPAARKALRDSVIVEALNPKSALFYLAFLPQFTDAAAELPIWMQIVVLGLFVNVMFTMTDAILIEASHAIATRLRRSARFVFVLQRLGGALLIGLGVKLALARSQ